MFFKRMDTEILEELGLTNAEIKTYIALLELGSSTAGNILEKSNLQNSVVHRALNTLIEKGLVNFILEGKIKIYQATDPENFNNFIEEKKRRFNEILPQLKEMQSIAPKKESATIFKGIRGINEIYNFMINLVDENGNNEELEYNTFGGGQQCVVRMGMPWWTNLHTKRVERKLRCRQVYDETVRKDAPEIEAKPLTDVKYLPAEFAAFQETVIVGDYVAINVFADQPYGFLMHDKGVAKSYKKYFELLWKMAKK